jgi:hypothetical protein
MTAQVGIQSNRLCFADTSAANRPMVTTFQQVDGELVWRFDFDWKRTAMKKAYAFHQLTSRADVGCHQDNGWHQPGVDGDLVYETRLRRGGGDTSLAATGASDHPGNPNLDTHTYQLSVNGTWSGQASLR